MSEDVWPKYKIEYDSYEKNYKLYYKESDHPFSEWRHYWTYPFKWWAIMKAKSESKNDEKQRNRTFTQVWGPYP